jgi:hypothetical protein
MKPGDWRWVKPDPTGTLEAYTEAPWTPGLVVEIAGNPPASAFLEAQDGRRGTVAIDRVGELCVEGEFMPAAWVAMQRRAAEIAAADRKGEPCSR